MCGGYKRIDLQEGNLIFSSLHDTFRPYKMQWSSFSLSTFNGPISFWVSLVEKTTILVSIHTCSKFLAFLLFSCYFPTPQLLSFNRSFLLQIIFKPPLPLLFLILLLFLRSVILLVYLDQLQQILHSTEIFRDDMVVEKCSLWHLELRIIYHGVLKTHWENALKVEDMGRPRSKRYDLREMHVGQLMWHFW